MHGVLSGSEMSERRMIMKKLICALLALCMAFALAACGEAKPAKNNAADIRINIDGDGAIAWAEEGAELDFGDGNTSAALFTVSVPAKYTIGAKTEEEGWYFSEWTKNGEFYSGEPVITVELTEETEFVAVFAFNEDDGQNPVMNVVGEYVCDRARALVEAVGDKDALITIEWGGSAWSLARWVITGEFNSETLRVDYTGCVKTEVTYGDDGAVSEENTVYEDGTGFIAFTDAGTFTWHEDGAEREDMLFEWFPTVE